MPASLPVRDFRMQDLVEIFGVGTVAEHVPLVMLRHLHEGDWPSQARFTDFHSLLIADRGRGLHVVNSLPYGFARGDVAVLGAGGRHTFLGSDDLLLYGVLFADDVFDEATWRALHDIPGLDELLGPGGSGTRFHLDPSAYTQVGDDLEELWLEWQTPSVAHATVVRALFLRLLARLARFTVGASVHPIRQRTRGRPHEEVVADAVRMIDFRHGVGIRVEELAVAAHLSRRHFTEVFVAVMGRTPSDYIRYVRLEHAKMLLTKTSIPVANIARMTGFVDPSHLTRAFRKANDDTPRAFRKRSQMRKDVHQSVDGRVGSARLHYG